MTCEKCRCCEAYICGQGTPHEEQWKMCLWCADGVPCPNAVNKKKRQEAERAAAASVPAHRHEQGMIHFATSRSYTQNRRQPRSSPAEIARLIPSTSNDGETAMPKNNIDEVRDHLFDTLRSLKGNVTEIEIERAKAVCNVAGKIIDTGKLEVSFMQATKTKSCTEFFGDVPAKPALPAPPEVSRPNGKTNGHSAR